MKETDTIAIIGIGSPSSVAHHIAVDALKEKGVLIWKIKTRDGVTPNENLYGKKFNQILCGVGLGGNQARCST